MREDELAKVFPSHTIHGLVSLPTTRSAGLFAASPRLRIQSLNALRELFSCWPGCPATILEAQPLRGTETDAEIEAVEHALATLYVTTFFDLFGRAPLVPHLLPPIPI